MKKLCFIVNGLYPEKVGGAEIFNTFLIRHLKDYNITILSPVITRIKDVTTIKHLNFNRWARDFSIAFHILTRQFDCVLLSFMRAPISHWKIISLACRIKRIPYKVVIHGGSKPELYDRRFLTTFLEGASDVIAVSKQIKDNYLPYVSNIVEIPSDIPFETEITPTVETKNKLDALRDNKIILLVGSLKEIKGTPSVLEVVRMFKGLRDFESFHFIFAGDGPLYASAKEYILQNELSQNVSFLGNVAHDQLSHFYKEAYMYLIASQFESNSISLLQAVYYECPPVCSRVPVLNSEYKEDEVVFSEFDNPLSIFDSIKYVDNNYEKCKAMVINAKRRRIARFDYHSNVVEKYIKLLN